MATHSIVVRISRKVIRWMFVYRHDRDFLRKHILPWALPEAEELPEEYAGQDFAVCVSFDRDNIHEVADLPCFRFILAGECYVRYPHLPNAAVFVQNWNWRDLFSGVHYAPQMMMWCPSVSAPKTKCCSVVESGKYAWRVDVINRLRQAIPVDVYGKMTGMTFGGYHGREATDPADNDKYLGIRDYAFYLALENRRVPDYLTEKINDAIMCEAVPIYRGAPNIHLYYVPNSYIPIENANTIDWAHWSSEYERRRPAVLRQKELLRTRFNVFSYFNLLTDNMSLLTRRRPITL